MQLEKETVKEKDRPKTASCGSSRNSSSPCFSDQSGDTEKVYSSSDYDDDLDDDVVKGEENSHSTPGAKQQSCLLQDLQSDIQHGDSEKQKGIISFECYHQILKLLSLSYKSSTNCCSCYY